MSRFNRPMNAAFRKHGLSLRGAAAKLLRSHIQTINWEQEEPGSLKMYLDEIVTKIKDQGKLSSSFVDADVMEQALTVLLQLVDGDVDNNISSISKSTGLDPTDEFIQYIDAFDTPRFKYEPVRKIFRRLETDDQEDAQSMNVDKKKTRGRGKLHGTSQDKVDMLKDRLELIHQRVMRNSSFAPPVNVGPAHGPADYFPITNIETLVGTSGTTKCIFGMLTELVEGQYFIEDCNASIRVDISDCLCTTGMFTDHCMVLAEGQLIDDVFKVSTLGFPPPEPRSETISTFSNLSCFGVDFQSPDRLKEVKNRANSLAQREDDMIVVVSDVHLDNPKVLEKLNTMFEAFDHSSPPVVALMGNFCSKPFPATATWSDMKSYKRGFDQLARIISKYQNLVKNTKILIIPGPQDPGAANILPRQPLPSIFTKRLTDKLPNVTLASNPCRLLYFNKEIVFFREDLLHKMRRNCILPPANHETDSQIDHLVKTICDQAHLCPLPPTKRPVYWNYDHSLRLYPLPQVLVLSESVDQYEKTYEGTHSFNPGSFSTDFSFVVYMPAADQAQFSQIDE